MVWVQLLQQHYVKVIEPAVEVSPAEQTSCSTGLAALIRAVEDRALSTLQSGITVFFGQVRACLWLPPDEVSHACRAVVGGDEASPCPHGHGQSPGGNAAD